ncbi:MAG: HlyD family efflux transporter periplasmic adaptor subunit [Bacteroidota bacterium]|nr:HlyD family efflux transporter periplasmic adaptor subunit [Bacteroidota bacterium]
MADGKHNIDLRSEEVQDIMSDIPGKIIRWGTTIIFIILILLIVGCFFFKYPDIIYANVTVTTKEPPAVIIAHSTGKIDAVFVDNQQVVDSGMPLAVIENPAAFEDMQLLTKRLSQWNPEQSDITSGIALFRSSLLRLGTVQSAYAEFLSALQDYSEYLTLNYYTQKISLQKGQLKSRNSNLLEMRKQQRLLKLQLKQTAIVFRRDSLLYLRGVNSKEELETSLNNLLKLQQSLSALNGSIKVAEIESSQTNESMLDLKQQDRDHENMFVLNLKSTYEKLLTQVKTWEQAYLLVSPIHGTVNLMGNWSPNQNVTSGETVFTILPDHLSAPIGKALVPATGSGKVKQGQVVLVRLNNFPDKEFGYIKGKVRSLSNVPLSDGNYVAEIQFPEGLKTNYAIKLTASGTLTGVAEIITNDIRLVERIIMPVKRVVRKHYQRTF